MPLSSLFTLLLVACCFSSVLCFGAGDISELSNQAGRAFRHGDIDACIEGMAKAIGGHVSGSAIVQGLTTAFLSGNVQGLAQAAKGGSVFSASDVKKIYFGSWLRDYSQACDIAGFSKLTADSIVFLISILSFLTFGYGTDEYEVTKERLSVYLLTEHIDNPLGYGGKEDPRQYDSRLRGRVEERELNIDPQNGMKAYIASSGQGFDTSADSIRRNLEKCIEYGRRGQSGNKNDLWEAYRYLGTALHTLEDLSAHSNFVELCLVKLGHQSVFCYTGENAHIQTPHARVAPLVTGTFGSTDFISSLLGEAGDKLSSSTIGRLNTKIDEAKNNDTKSLLATVQKILSQIPSSGDASEKANQLQDVQNKAYNIDPDKVVPEEAQQAFLQALNIRDDVMRTIEGLLEQFPMVQEFLDQLSNALTLVVMSIIEPYFQPIIAKLVDGLSTGNEALLQDEDQLSIFNDPNSTDPTHSIISKDHFENQLNFVAGKVAVTVVKHTVTAVVRAWSDNSDPRQTIDYVLKTLHHPYFTDGRCDLQNDMFETVKDWAQSLGHNRERIIASLSKNSVKEGNNKVEGASNMGVMGHGCSHSSQQHRPNAGRQGIAHQQQSQNRFAQPQPPQVYGQQAHNNHQNQENTGNRYSDQQSENPGYGNPQQSTYGQSSYAANQNAYSSNNDRRPSGNNFGRSNEYDSSNNNQYSSNNSQNGRTNEYSAQARRDDDFGVGQMSLGGNQGDYSRTQGSDYSHRNESHQSEYGSRREDHRQEERQQQFGENRQERFEGGRESFGHRAENRREYSQERQRYGGDSREEGNRFQGGDSGSDERRRPNTDENENRRSEHHGRHDQERQERYGRD